MGLKLTFYKKFYIFNLYIAYIFAIPVRGRSRTGQEEFIQTE